MNGDIRHASPSSDTAHRSETFPIFHRDAQAKVTFLGAFAFAAAASAFPMNSIAADDAQAANLAAVRRPDPKGYSSGSSSRRRSKQSP